MFGRTHILIGVAGWVVAAETLGQPLSVESLAAAALGSLLPDIDHPRAMLGRRLPGVSHIIRAVAGHRGFTHSAFAVVLLVLGLNALSPANWHLALVLGMASHLMADMLTPGGIPLLWPVKMRIRSPLVFRSGGVVEYSLNFAVLGGLVWFFR